MQLLPPLAVRIVRLEFQGFLLQRHRRLAFIPPIIPPERGLLWLCLALAVSAATATQPRTHPRAFRPRSLTAEVATLPPKKAGRGNADGGADGIAVVLAAVGELEKIMEEIPSDFIPHFEEAAQEMIRAFKDRRAGDEADDDCGTGTAGQVHADACNPGRDAKRRKKADKDDPFQKMRDIQYWLRLMVPSEAVLPSESIVYGHEGTDFADYTPQNTQSVDGFLYEEEDVDDLCDEGKLARSYCAACGSRDIKDLNFISHSLAIRELEFIFKQALPGVKCQLENSCLVDVGSRLGGVVYAACVFAKTKEAVGIEMNADLCKVQEEALKIFGFQGRARIICDDVLKQQQVLAKANVVVLHNVFQFFLEKKEAADAWSILMGALSPGTLLVTCPPIEEQLASSCGKKVAGLHPIAWPGPRGKYAPDPARLGCLCCALC